MRFAKRVGTNPRELAQKLAEQLGRIEGVAKTEVAGPGSSTSCSTLPQPASLRARSVDARRGTYGASDALADKKINLEFVSANPTGPIHMGGTRWAAAGDALARVLESQGASVTRE